MQSHPLSNFIEHQNEYITINDSQEYTRVTTKLHRKGVVLRDVVKGLEIKTKKQQVCKANQLLVAEIDAKVGGYGIVPKELEGSIVSSHYFLFNINPEGLLPDYLAYVLKTDSFFSQIKAQGSTNYAAVRPRDILKIEIPYCNVDLQRHVVEKLDSITAKGIHLGNNILKGKDHIFRLRQTILQEAVYGKLVPKNPEDEPVSELLRRIEKEKEKFFCERKIKKENPLPTIAKEDIPYDLPKGWEWVRLGNIALKVQDGTHFSPEIQYDEPSPNRYLYITSKNIKEAGIDTSTATYIDAEVHKSITQRCNPEFLDILMIKDGAITGRVTINDIKEEFSLLSSVALIKTDRVNVENKFLLYYLRSPIGFEQVTGRMSGSAITRIILEKIKNTIIPFPPLSEQRRIVTRVDQLMKLCDELDEKVKENQNRSELLIEAILKEAFAS
jgi:type I restriction enzyme S subunit